MTLFAAVILYTTHYTIHYSTEQITLLCYRINSPTLNSCRNYWVLINNHLILWYEALYLYGSFPKLFKRLSNIYDGVTHPWVANIIIKICWVLQKLTNLWIAENFWMAVNCRIAKSFSINLVAISSDILKMVTSEKWTGKLLFIVTLPVPWPLSITPPSGTSQHWLASFGC